MRTLVVLLSSLCAICCLDAVAAWTYDSSAKTLSDGNWTFTVSKGSFAGREGLCIDSTAFSQTDASQCDIDFTSCPTDPECGYPLLAVTALFRKTLPVRKFIAPDLVQFNLYSGGVFAGNTNLEEAVVSPDIYSMGGNNGCAFSDCTSLRKLTPTRLLKLAFAKKIFNKCSSLEGDFEFGWTTMNEDNPLSGCDKITSFALPNLTTLGKASIFYQLHSLTNVYAPKLKTVGSSEFRECTSLKTLVLSDAISSLPYYFLGSCGKLESLYPMTFTNVTELGEGSFLGCSSLAGDLSFPKVKSLPTSCFKNMTGLGSVSAPGAVIGGGNYIFEGCSSLTNLVIGGFDGTRQYTFGDKIRCRNLAHIWVTGAYPAPATSHKDGIFSPEVNGNASTRPPILHIRESSHVYSAWEANCYEVKANLSDGAKKVANYADGTVDPEALVGFLGCGFTFNNDGSVKAYYPYRSDLCWFVRWDDETFVRMSVAVPDHVVVQEVLCNGVHVNCYGDRYEVPQSGSLAITYTVIDGMTFGDGTTECTVTGVTPQETLPASTCGKAVVEAVLKTVSVDLAALNAARISDVSLACDVDFTCATNESSVITWSVASGIPFTITYTADEGVYFDESPTMSVTYADGVTTDLTVDVETLSKPEAAEDLWKEVVDSSSGQHYLQNLGLGWKLYVESGKSTINGVTGYNIYRASTESVTAVALARADGVLDLTDVESEADYPVVAVGYGAFNDYYTNSWKLTKFIAPKCQSIDKYAFEKQKLLGDVVISGTASSLFSERAFNGCSSLTNFTPTVFPNVTFIGPNAFTGAPVGGDWVLAGVKSSERTFFNGCANPNGFSVSLPNFEKFVGGNSASAFANSTITNFSAPKLTKINAGQTFSGCSRLTDVTLPSEISEIAGSAFAYCSSLRNIYPRAFTNLTWLGGSAFLNCSSLEGGLSFPKLTAFCSCTFQGASKLGSVVAPQAVVGNLKSGGDKVNYLFTGCTSLTNVVLGGIDGSGQYTFQNCSKLEHIWLTGASAAPATNHVLGCFSQGWNGNASTRPPILHVRLSKSESDYSGWEALCTQSKARVMSEGCTTQKIANYADRTVPRSKLIGYLGGDVVLKQDGSIDHYYAYGWDLCWFVKWEESGTFLTVR